MLISTEWADVNRRFRMSGHDNRKSIDYGFLFRNSFRIEAERRKFVVSSSTRAVRKSISPRGPVRDLQDHMHVPTRYEPLKNHRTHRALAHRGKAPNVEQADREGGRLSMLGLLRLCGDVTCSAYGVKTASLGVFSSRFCTSARETKRDLKAPRRTDLNP